MNVNMPRKIKRSVSMPMTRLAKAVMLVRNVSACISDITAGAYRVRAKITAICHGPMPPLEGIPMAIDERTKQTRTQIIPLS